MEGHARRTKPAIGAVVVLGLLLILPMFLGDYETERLAGTIAVAIAVLGLVVLTGWSGQISLGHGAFFGIGAYTTVILLTRAHLPHLVTLVVATSVGLVGGAVAGLPALRVTGIYLALFSLALATVFPAFVQHFASFTGGTEGMSAPAYTPFLGGVSQNHWGYYVALAVAVPLFLLVYDLGHSRVGSALRALRESEPAARAMGINVSAYKVGAFALSGGLAALGGSLSMIVQPFPYIDPRSFTIALSISLVTGLVVGGAGSVVGAVVAALFLDRVPELTTDVAHLDGVATNFFYGALLILLMFVMPTGIVGFAAIVSTRLRRSALMRRYRPG